MSARITPVILSGGSGTRLWPMSRGERPKQFLPLLGERTMLQMTADRVGGAPFGPLIVVAGERHLAVVEEQLAAIAAPLDTLILEPAARNTAPAIALAALAAPRPDTPLLVMPSDHAIANIAAFRRAVDAALPIVADGWLATFGIAPDAAETGYGYIRVGEPLATGVNRVARFVEKPQREVAEAMLASGDHVWNGGIFLFRADALLAALAEHAPEILAAAERAMAGAGRDGARVRPAAADFAGAPALSIDVAVMEQAERVAVVPVEMGWSDVGSWDALHAIAPRDAGGNAFAGPVRAIDTEGCLVRSDSVRVSLVGVRDLVVVASGDEVLVLPRGRAQEVKRLLDIA